MQTMQMCSLPLFFTARFSRSAYFIPQPNLFFRYQLYMPHILLELQPQHTGITQWNSHCVTNISPDHLIIFPFSILPTTNRTYQIKMKNCLCHAVNYLPPVFFFYDGLFEMESLITQYCTFVVVPFFVPCNVMCVRYPPQLQTHTHTHMYCSILYVDPSSRLNS